MAGGLLVAAATPCTLASAAVWTRRAGGNDATAVLVTIVTNLLCVVVTPLWMVVFTGRSVAGPDLTFAGMASKLAILVVLPMTAAQCLRVVGRLGSWATSHRIALGVLAQCGILSMVLIGSIQAGSRLRSSEVLLVWDLLSMLAAVIAVHLVMFWVGITLAKRLRFDRQEQIAVGFAGSQKTLMVGLLMALSLGFSILPMVTYHVCQLLIDTVIADRLREQGLADVRQVTG
jgi:sodium/bile acid cotransporter 7